MLAAVAVAVLLLVGGGHGPGRHMSSPPPSALIVFPFQALSTPWGLFRHYWVIVKLVIARVATLILIAYTGTLSGFAEVAARSPLTGPDVEFPRSPSGVTHSAGAFELLLTATVLAVYKPAGLTRHGQRMSQRQRIRPTA